MSGMQMTGTLRPRKFTLNSAATTNITQVFVGPGRIVGINGSNVNAAARFLKLYDRATVPVLATDRPQLTVQMPAAGAAMPVQIPPGGFVIEAGLAIALTGASGDTDTTAVAANEQKVVIHWFPE